MLDSFLEVAYSQQERARGNEELGGLLRQLPVDELGKLASGTALADMYTTTKVAYSESETFLDRFKGTPLLEQAIQLEQEELQTDMLEQQKRREERQQRAADDSVWDVRDKIRLKKRLLELELARHESGGGTPPAAPAPVPGEGAQGAGAPGDVPAEGVQDNAQGVVGGKTAGAIAEAGSKQLMSDLLKEQAEEDTPEERQALADYATRTSRLKALAQGTALGGGLGMGVGGVSGMVGGAASGGIMGAIMPGAGGRLHGALRGAAQGGIGGFVPGMLMGGGAGALAGGMGASRAHSLGKQYADEAKGSAGKTAAAVSLADQMGRSMARADFEKSARAVELLDIGGKAGVALAKSAGVADMVMPALKTLGQGAMSWAKRNPLGAAATVGGAALGGAKGLREGGVSGALTGAAGGGLLGNVAARGAQGFMANRAAGQGVSSALGNVAMSGIQRGAGLMNGA